MKKSRIAVGGLMFEENQEWTLDVQAGGSIIVGRRLGDDVGLLCVRYCAADTLRGPLTHEYCLEVARVMLNVPGGDRVEQIELHEGPSGPHGAATFLGGRDVRRVFYCNRPAGLIVGVYSCPAEFARDALRNLARRESEHLLSTAVFDRPSWGGADPLTRILTDNPGEGGKRPDEGEWRGDEEA
jgi:hypothetical protein